MSMVKRKKKDKRIINFKSQNHKHVFNKSKLKAVKRKKDQNDITYENTKMYIINQNPKSNRIFTYPYPNTLNF